MVDRQESSKGRSIGDVRRDHWDTRVLDLQKASTGWEVVKRGRPVVSTMPATDNEAPEESTVFPVEDIVQCPLPGYVAPASVAFSPDDKLISFLFSPDGNLNRKIFSFDSATRQQHLLVSPPGGGVDENNLSTAEKLRRERLRERGLGVTKYEWAKGSLTSRLMVPLPGGIYVQDAPGSELRLRIASTPSSPILDPQLSPDGNFIAYVHDDEIYVLPITSGEPVQITFGAAGAGKELEALNTDHQRLKSICLEPIAWGSDGTHGLAEYIAQEEMERRNGFWWSPDSKLIAFAEVDASVIPLFRIMHQGKAAIGAEAQEDHAYPFAGCANASVRLGIAVATGDEIERDPTWVDLHCGICNEEEYLARVAWMPDGSLTAQVQSRDQTKLKLLKFDRWTGKREVLLAEENTVWVNLHDCFTPLQKGPGQIAGGFIWASERTGFKHLYLYDGAGNCMGALTEGSWLVEQVAGVDENSGIIYFTGTLDSPLETHLYSSELFPDFNLPLPPPRKLTQGKGRHVVVLDHQMEKFVDIHDSLDTPPRVLMCSLETGEVIAPVYEQPGPTPRAQRLQLAAPELVQLTAGDGTTLYGALYKPDMNRYGPPPYRTVVSVYGGPNVQTVCNSWMNTVDMRAQYLRSKGLLVWKLDNRGSARRGLQFEGAIKNNMGVVDVEDQEVGVKWLLQAGFAKVGKVGIYGWSYGGYMAAMSLARCPDLFRCSVAGAPVTAWDGYDTHYTEKYLGTPGNNPQVFESTSVMYHVQRMQGKLLLVHGMIDENVHFRHTARLINALTAAGKEYELLIFPDERHMPRGLRDRMYMEERICGFLDRNL